MKINNMIILFPASIAAGLIIAYGLLSQPVKGIQEIVAGPVHINQFWEYHQLSSRQDITRYELDADINPDSCPAYDPAAARKAEAQTDRLLEGSGFQFSYKSLATDSTSGQIHHYVLMVGMDSSNNNLDDPSTLERVIELGKNISESTDCK